MDPKTNSKGALMQFVQRKMGRPVQKDDIQFKVEKFGEGYQATLCIPHLGDGMEFVGELGGSAKQAEQLAASQAVSTYAKEIQTLDATFVRQKDLKRAQRDEGQLGDFADKPLAAAGSSHNGASGPPKKARPLPTSSASAPAESKNLLNQLLQRLLQRPIKKEDFDYAIEKYDEGFQCTMTLACMEGAVFVGEVAENSKDCQNSAAQIALKCYASEEIRLPGPGKGKGAPPPRQAAPAKGILAPSVAKGTPKGALKGKSFPGKGMLSPFAAKGKGALPAQLFPQWQRPMMGKGAAMPIGGKPFQLPVGRVSPKGSLPLRALPVRAQETAKEAKCRLNNFLQRFLKRPVTKQDIEWSMEKIDEDHFQATLLLVCLDSEVYVSEVAATEKEAGDMAAQLALTEHANDVEAIDASFGPGKKRKREPGEPPQPNPVSLTSKSELNSMCMKIMKRTLTKGEIVYETNRAEPDGGFQAAVSVDFLQDATGTGVWTGEVSESKQLAEQSAAKEAVEAIQATPEHAQTLLERANEPPRKKGKGKGKDKEEN